MSENLLNLYVIRHGTTELNLAGRLCGWEDAPLAQQGADELRELAKSYPYPKIERLFASPLRRCRETAAIAFPNIEAETIEDIKEFHFGDCERTLAREALGRPGVFERWLAHDDTLGFPGGETVAECRKRGVRGFREIISRALAEGCDEVGVVAHGTVLSLVFDELLAQPIPNAEPLVPNGMGYLFGVDKNNADCERPLVFLDYIPQGAPRPDTAMSPFINPGGDN